VSSAGRAAISEARTVRRLSVFLQACAFAEGRTVDFHTSPVHVVPDLGDTSCTRETVVMSVAGNRARLTTTQRPLMDSPSTSATTRVRAWIHNDETRNKEMSDR
jgi:hypothetical protein